jgi:DNA/RNA endonuclease YhcR with UshA esterase domain
MKKRFIAVGILGALTAFGTIMFREPETPVPEIIYIDQEKYEDDTLDKIIILSEIMKDKEATEAEGSEIK